MSPLETGLAVRLVYEVILLVGSSWLADAVDVDCLCYSALRAVTSFSCEDLLIELATEDELLASELYLGAFEAVVPGFWTL